MFTMQGKLIIIESGSDASGKATQTQKLYDRLVSEGFKVKKITFPNYGTPACKPVEMYLNGEFGNSPLDVNAYVASTFYAIDRFASYKQEWKELYDNGWIILADRYTTSNMVHQAAKMDLSDREEYLNWLYNLEFELYQLPKPTKVIFLNVEPEISQNLMKDRANKITGNLEKDIHEKDKDYLIKSYENSIYIAEKYNWDIINCVSNGKLLSIDDIHNKIYESLKLELR